MDELIQLIREINRGTSRSLGIYSEWSRRYNISYNEMLVLHMIKDEGFCTQKHICESYLMPRQTINHLFSKLRKDGLIEIDPKLSIGKEKAFVLTKKGKKYAAPFLDSMNRVELRTAELMGEKKMRRILALSNEYNRALQTALNENTNDE